MSLRFYRALLRSGAAVVMVSTVASRAKSHFSESSFTQNNPKKSIGFIVFMGYLILVGGLLASARQVQAAGEHSLSAVIDAVIEKPYSEIGQSSVVKSPLGAYREVGSNRNDRMTYLFEADDVGDLARLTLVYPDDKPRLAEVFLLSKAAPMPFSVFGSGYITGYPYAITQKRIEQSFYFYVPASTEFAIVLMTAKDDAPAAVSTLKLERVSERQGIPSWPSEAAQANRRKLGMYWEDPGMIKNFGIARKINEEDTQEFRAILDRQVAYMQRVGHNMVIYPVVWYETALYQPSAEFTKADVKGGKRPHPADYDKLMAKRYSEEGIEFWPSIRNWKLPSLEQWIKTPDEIRSGNVTDYVNTVTASGEVKTRSRWHDPPFLNALHPRVRTALKDLVTDIMDRIGAEKSVRGVALFTTIHSSHGLGTIDQSYDDYTLKQFAADTGIALPTPSGRAQDRFEQWHDWLRQRHWQTWIKWRKKKQTEVYAELARIVAAKKPGAKLQVMVMYPVPTLDAGKTVDDISAYLDEIGLDLEALARNKDIVISRFYRSLEYQVQLRTRNAASRQMQSLLSRSDLDFNPQWQQPFVGKAKGAIIHYNYFEQSLKGQPRVPLPPDWRGEPPWHVTSPKGAGRNALEYLARSIAAYDALFIGHGGFQLGPQGMEEPLQPFSATFNSLPAVAFETLGEKEGIVLRSALTEGACWIYLINGTQTAREVSLAFSTGGKLERLGLKPEKLVVTPEKKVTLTIAPYELIAWKGDAKIALSGKQALSVTARND